MEVQFLVRLNLSKHKLVALTLRTPFQRLIDVKIVSEILVLTIYLPSLIYSFNYPNLLLYSSIL